MKKLIQCAVLLSLLPLPALADVVGLAVSGGPTLYKNQKNEVTPFPLIIYRDERFFVEGKTAGVNVMSMDDFYLSAVIEADLNKFKPKDAKTAAFRGLDERKSGLFAGAQITYRPSSYDTFNFKVLGDTGSNHKAVVPVTEWVHLFEMSDRTTQYATTVEVRFNPSKYNNYFYGVSNAESLRTGVKTFKADGKPEVNVSFGVGHMVTDMVKVFASVGVRSVGSSIKDSPIVERSTVAVGIVGVGYQF
jgi:MipA family protein